MNKRAVSETLVVVLAFVLVAFVLLAFSTQLSDLLKSNTDIEICKLSVLAQATTRKTPIGVDAPTTLTPLECPRRILKIFEDKAEIKINDKKAGTYKFKEANTDEVNHVAAEELKVCWYMLNEGNRNILENALIFGYNTCLICSEIEFDANLKGKSFSGLTDYVNSKKTKDGITYFEYLTRSQKNLYHLFGETYQRYYNIWAFGPSKENTEDMLLGDQKYAVYFVAYKPGWWTKPIPGTNGQVYYVGIGEENSITKQCEILVN